MARTKRNEYRFAVGRADGYQDFAYPEREARLDKIRLATEMQLTTLDGHNYKISLYIKGESYPCAEIDFEMTLDCYRIQDVFLSEFVPAYLEVNHSDFRAVAEGAIHRNWSAWHSRVNEANMAAAKGGN